MRRPLPRTNSRPFCHDKVTLAISIDAATSATYAGIRRGGDFARVVANLEYLRDLREKTGKQGFVLKFNVVVMKQNIHEMPMIIDLAARCGVGWVTFIPLLAGHTPEISSYVVDMPLEEVAYIYAQTANPRPGARDIGVVAGLCSGADARATLPGYNRRIVSRTETSLGSAGIADVCYLSGLAWQMLIAMETRYS